MNDRDFKRVMLILLLFLLIGECEGQRRQGTVTVDGNSYSVYESMDSYGGYHYDFRGDAHSLTAPQIKTELPGFVDHIPAIIYDKHFADSLKVNYEARTYWWLAYSDKYKSPTDPEFRKIMIKQLKKKKLISMDYYDRLDN